MQWLRTRPDFAQVTNIDLKERFISREIFGDYLRSIVKRNLEDNGGAEFVRGEALDMSLTDRGVS